MAASKKSGNPAKKAVSSVSDFKNKSTSVEELPSGLVVKLRNPGGLAAFMGPGSTGEIPNSLMPMIQEALKKGKSISAEELMPNNEIDSKLLSDMMRMMDNIAVRCMIEPNLQPALTMADVEKYNERNGLEGDEALVDPEQLRREDLLYIDELPDDDKQYIFAWLTSGVRDLETFRQQRQAGVDALAGIASPQGTTE